MAHQPAIVFFDDVEVLCGRSNGHHPIYFQQIQGVLLSTLTRIQNENQAVFFLGATNFLSRVDDAFRWRVDAVIEVPLPDTTQKTRMFEVYLRDIPHEIHDTTLWALSRGPETERFSGADILKSVEKATTMPIARLRNQKHRLWRKVSLIKLHSIVAPC